ncbi:ras-related protein Rab-32 [Epinephelus lanceolatus]|uniref:ras-related protein Rab-32 n=1 Tax=Epinephelus lanceolatus TaxID=310571 RepID=UPI001445FC38|nr:ras-related protein Rab-32 [Epinephelus lanceolatus]
MAQSSGTVYTDKLFKVLVIGDPGVGKSSFVLRYVRKRFDENYRSDIGVDFALKRIEWDAKTVVRLQLWDIAGQERFKKMSRVYYKGAMGAVVVFDITNSSTLEAASEWKQDLDSKVCLDSGCPIPAVLLANKCDLTGRDRDLVSSLDSFCKDNNFMGWFETSAKDNINIDEAGALLVRQMMLCDTGLSNEEHHWDGIKVSQAPGESQSQSLCCWRPRF